MQNLTDGEKKKIRLPGTFEVSTVCIVGGGAAGVIAGWTGACWVGLGGCIGPIPGLWTTPELTGINPLCVGVGATTWGSLWPGTVPTWDVTLPREPAPGGPDW